MAVEVDNGSGEVAAQFEVATDTIGGVEWPYAKLASGAVGSEELIGGSAAFGLEVDVTRVQGDVVVVGAGSAGSAAAGGVVGVGWLAQDSPRPSPVNAGAFVRPWASRRGALHTLPTPGGTNAVDKIAGSGAAAVTLASGLDGQTGLVIVNDVVDLAAVDPDDPNWLYVKLGADATTDDWTVRIYPGGALYITDWNPLPSGQITGIWADPDTSGATANARVTKVPGA